MLRMLFAVVMAMILMDIDYGLNLHMVGGDNHHLQIVIVVTVVEDQCVVECLGALTIEC